MYKNLVADVLRIGPGGCLFQPLLPAGDGPGLSTESIRKDSRLGRSGKPIGRGRRPLSADRHSARALFHCYARCDHRCARMASADPAGIVATSFRALPRQDRHSRREEQAMKHAGTEVLSQLESFLTQVRRCEGLREKRPGVFYLKSRAFLHFHEDPRGVFADIKLTNDFSRFPVNTPKQRERLLGRIDRLLSSR